MAPLFSITKTAELVGRTGAAIRTRKRTAACRRWNGPRRGGRIGYTLAEVNQMRAVFGTQPWRAESDPLAVIAVQNFKGGVGKSTVSTHLAQYLAIKGYRVCLIDCDSQGSATTMFGYVPDLDIGEEETLYPFIRNAEMSSLAYAVRETHWDGLFLVPANLKLYQARVRTGGTHRAVGQGADQPPGPGHCLDRVAFRRRDPRPAPCPRHHLAFGNARRQRAAGADPADGVDFTSTTTFLAMLHETMGVLEEQAADRAAMDAHAGDTGRRAEIHAARIAWGDAQPVRGDAAAHRAEDSAEIDNASARLMTVYDLERPVTSRDTYQRCLTYLNAVNAEIETLVRLTWPSHADRLRTEGVIDPGCRPATPLQHLEFVEGTLR